MKINNLILFILSIFLFISCDKEDFKLEINNQRTVFMYLPWSTNLTSYFYNNISDIEKAIQENGLDNERVIAFLSTSSSEAEMFEITLNNGVCKRNVLKEYVNPSFTTEAGLTNILRDMKTFAPAESYSIHKHYGILIHIKLGDKI